MYGTPCGHSIFVHTLSALQMNSERGGVCVDASFLAHILEGLPLLASLRERCLVTTEESLSKSRKILPSRVNLCDSTFLSDFNFNFCDRTVSPVSQQNLKKPIHFPSQFSIRNWQGAEPAGVATHAVLRCPNLSTMNAREKTTTLRSCPSDLRGSNPGYGTDVLCVTCIGRERSTQICSAVQRNFITAKCKQQNEISF